MRETQKYLGYGQVSNHNHSLKIVLIYRGNHKELLQYFYYLSLGFYSISFCDKSLQIQKVDDLIYLIQGLYVISNI